MNQNQKQSQNKVGNPETQIPKTPQMNERDFVNDMLATEKYMTNSYSTALHEFSNSHLYQEVLGIYNETEKCQRDLYDLMFKNGWYNLEMAEQQKLQQSYKQFSDYAEQQSPYKNMKH
ncbi:spore coat protein [Metabacillus sp. RGM 3146]|uniref:spore coat protein n=1 Tax=Metabacillus sp. RGM 3146 TaxID=3401092 RepID=UPI003B9B628D